jgi:type II secretory pathway component PulJ
MPARADRRSGSAGFTLVETLMALAATAAMLAALATAVPTALRAHEGSRGRLDRSSSAAAVLSQLEREIAAAIDEPLVLDESPPRLAFSGGPEPGARLVYTVEGDALRRHAGPRFAPEDAGVRGAPMLEGVRAVELRAFDGSEWLSSWRAGRLPIAVRIRIDFTDGETLAAVVPIPTATGPR